MVYELFDGDVVQHFSPYSFGLQRCRNSSLSLIGLISYRYISYSDGFFAFASTGNRSFSSCSVMPVSSANMLHVQQLFSQPPNVVPERMKALPRCSPVVASMNMKATVSYGDRYSQSVNLLSSDSILRHSSRLAFSSVTLRLTLIILLSLLHERQCHGKVGDGVQIRVFFTVVVFDAFDFQFGHHDGDIHFRIVAAEPSFGNVPEHDARIAVFFGLLPVEHVFHTVEVVGDARVDAWLNVFERVFHSRRLRWVEDYAARAFQSVIIGCFGGNRLVHVFHHLIPIVFP
nr:MAG TPA: hypothetical protein [Caudoviricetes sp.]